MSGIPPFTNATTPLKNAPYYSRVGNTNLINDLNNVNYPIIAFKPGYALQASELNEIQDNFYIQQTLSNTLLNNWWKTGNNINLTGTETSPLYGPGWEGAIPLSPDYITLLDNGVFFSFNAVSLPTDNAEQQRYLRWMLLTDPTTKFKFWCAINLFRISNILVFPSTLPPITYVGLRIQSSFVNCSSDETNAGYIFNDNSSGGYIQNTCGASRFKIATTANNPFVTQTTLTGNFLPIIKIRKNADTESENLLLIQYMNNYLIFKRAIT
jgi:hypothetical protein